MDPSGRVAQRVATHGKVEAQTVCMLCLVARTKENLLDDVTGILKVFSLVKYLESRKVDVEKKYCLKTTSACFHEMACGTLKDLR